MRDKLVRIPIVLCAVFAFVAVGLIAGCGSTEENNSYIDQVNEIQKTANAALQKASATPSTPQAYAANLDSAANALDDAVVKVKALDAPSDAKQGNVAFLAAVTAMRDAFKRAASQAQGASVAQATQISAAATPAVKQALNQIDAAINQINKGVGGN